MMRLKIGTIVALTTLCTFRPALADEQMTPLAAQGNWIAMSHSDSVTDPPDVCFAASLDGFALRTDENDNEIRYTNSAWALPADVSGKIIVEVNGKTYNFDIVSNTDSMVTAEVSTQQLQSLVADMNKAGTLSVIAGSAAPITISLAGSNTAVSAYLTCADISAPAGETPAGANPFASGTSQ